MQELVLGVDFGSSSTIAGALVADRLELIRDGGDAVIPSVVYIPDRGAMEIGRRAAARQLTEPFRVVRSIKRLLGLTTRDDLVRHYISSCPIRIDRSGLRPVFKLRSGDIAPEQIAAAILARVRELAEQRFGTRVQKIVLTMSAAAPPEYRDAAIRTARLAHLEVVEVIAEPIAGALALDLHRRPERRRVVVCDFGGGTFDVSAVAQDGLRFTPIAIAGDAYLGGDDLDDTMAEAIAGTIVRNTGYDMHCDVVRWSELVFRCESAKRQLGSSSSAPLVMREAYRHRGVARDLRLTIEHGWLSAVWAALMKRVEDVVRELLCRAGWKSAEVDVVGLLGGSSQVPLFRRAIAGMFDVDRLLPAPDPELAVAQGATLLSARHVPGSAVPRFVA